MPAHLFILDGPDAAGKTTLADRIVKDHGAYYMHMSYEPNDRKMFDIHYRSYLKASTLLARGQSVVIDRSWMSENIYAYVYRGKSGMGAQMRGLDRVAMGLSAVYIICAPDPDSAVERHRKSHSEREEMYAPDERIRRVAEIYRALWKAPTIPMDLSGDDTNYTLSLIRSQNGMRRRPDTMLYDIDVDGSQLDYVVERAIHMSECLQKAQWSHARSTRNFVGRMSTAKWLMVGDKTNPQISKSDLWPFVAYSGSSRTMAQVCQRLNIVEDGLAWSNVNANHDIVRTLWHLYNVGIIALGDEASRTLEGMNVPHKKVYHPSFVGRFNKFDEYYEQLSILI